ncbi:MAG: hypothetical protein AAF990_08025 [Bacteroidota bacterium]
MLSLFRTNQIVANFLLLFYAVFLRFSVFWVAPSFEPTFNGVLGEYTIRSIGTLGVFPFILGVILLSLQALLINITISRYRTAGELSLFPGLFYILLASSFPEFLFLSPALIANTFYILALMEMMHTYKNNAAAGRIVNAGFWIAIGSLFYFSHIVFLILAFSALGILRAFRLKEAIMVIIGFAVPYVIANVYFFWTDQWSMFWQQQFVNTWSFLDVSRLSIQGDQLFRLIFLVLITLVALLSFRRYTVKKKIQVQKNINIIYWALFWGALTFLFQADIQYDHFLILLPPLGILLSINFLQMKPPTAESLHLLLYVGIIVSHFLPLLLN